MAIEKEKLMHECSPEHLRMGTGSGASPSIAFATALGLFILFLLLTNYFILLLFSSLVELQPNILLYRHIYL